MVNEKGDEEVSNTSSGDETLDDDEQVDNDVAQHEIERAFPDSFYDPTTDQVMTDPVINPIGDSYNESTMFDSFVTYYPNRALKAIIDREIETESTSIRGSLLRIDDSIRSTIMNAVSITGLCEEVRPLPDSFYCPITCELIVDPVVSPDGNTYERAAIVEWLSEHDVSPITRDPLTLSELRPNNALYKLIQQEKSKSVESQHPSIRQWQESGVDTSTRNQEPLENATTYEPQPLRSAPVDPPADEEPAAPPASSHFSVTKLIFYSVLAIALFPLCMVLCLVPTLYEHARCIQESEASSMAKLSLVIVSAFLFPLLYVGFVVCLVVQLVQLASKK